MQTRRRVRVDGYHPKSAGDEPDAPPSPRPPETCDCPELDPDDWQGVESDWSDITFVRAGAGALLGVVTGLGAVRAKLLAKAARIGANVPPDAMLLLGPGQFRRPAMLEVEDLPAGAKKVARPGGVAYSRLLDAPPGQVRKAVRQLTEEAIERYRRKPDDLWLWYLTCRVCSADRNYETLVIAHYRQAPSPTALAGGAD